MEEEFSFPRGGSERPSETSEQASTVKKVKDSASSSSSSKADSRKRSNSSDFLFGSKDDKKKRIKTSGTTSSSSGNHSKNSTAAATAASSSALPIGGGGVLQPVQSSSSKKPAFIESLSFQKLAKGTKLLGIVREVAEDYAVVSLPSMLTGFIRQDGKKSEIPLNRVVSVGQFLAVVVVKATSETVKTKDGNKPQMKRRIEVSVSPSLMNNGITMDMLHERMVIRGKIRSIEDHGCIVDLQMSGLGTTSCFLKYENIHGAYKIMHEDDEEEEEQDKIQDVTKEFILNHGRIYDFTIKSLPGKKSKTEAINIIQVELEGVRMRRERTIDPAIHLSFGHTIRTLTPGMLLDVDVEHFARNGLCVSLLGNVYRGSIDSGHLGGYLPEHDKIKDVVNKSDLLDMWWKKVFVGKNRKVRARLIAVDPATKIIRLSLIPHILALERNNDGDDDLPAVGSIIQNARVVRLDPGVGALLALPDNKSHDKMDIDDDSGENKGLKANPIFSAASKIKCAYVHISKAIDVDEKRTPEALFSKTFALNTTIPKLRILSTSNWLENVASCATAESIISSAVLTHSDLKPGTIYKAVPVIATLEGGGVLVQLGGMGVKGFIPATHIFDKTSSGDNSYRNKIRMEKYKIGNKVDVRCLEVKPNEKKCIVTAKKSLLTTDLDNPVIDYEHITPGRLATGFVSNSTKKGIVVTFYNNVHGRIDARQLAEEMGVEDPTTDYKIGDVLKVRIVECTKSNHKDDDDYSFYVLRLSLDISGSSDTKKVRHPQEKAQDLHGLLSPGLVLPAKSMKIVELVSSREKDDSEGFIPGHVLVTVKAKYLSSSEASKGNITCKLPFEQIFDSYDEKAIESAASFDGIVENILVVGKKIAQEGMVLATSSAKGLAITPIISLKPSLINIAKNQSKDNSEGSHDVLLPTPQTPLYMGAYVQGYCIRIDSRYGAFIRFLDNLTAIVPKLKGGLNVGLFDTVLCKIVAMDVTSGNAPKILLKRVKSTKKQITAVPLKKTNLVEKIKPGDDLGDVKVESINFARAAVTLLDKKFEGCVVKARIHVTMAEPVAGFSNSMPVLVNSDDELPDLSEEKEKISSYHPFHSWTVGSIIKDTKCVAIDVRDGINYIELTNRTEGNGDDDIPTFVEDPRSFKAGSTVSAVITAVSKKNQGIWVQICPGCTGFIPGLELTRDVDMLNKMTKYFRIGGRIKCKVLPNQAKEGPFQKVVRLSALDTDKVTKPTRGDIMVGRVNRNIKQTNAPALMIELAGNHIGRCDITELEEVDDWENMPLGKVSNEEAEDVVNEDSINRFNEGEYRHGLYLQCRVLSTSGTGPCEVSLRGSRLEGDLENDLPPEEKEIVHAFVVNTNKKGCFLRLSRNIEGRVILKELSDSFLPDPVSMFPPGRLVVGKVKKVSTTKDKRKKSSNKMIVDLDLRESVILEDQNKISFDDLEEGQKHRGIVTRIEPYGVFVRLENSDVSGLVHLSESSDDYIKNLASLYDPGDLVKVLVIKITKEDRRIGLSMKASHFEDDESEDESDSDDESDDENAAGQMANFVDDSDDSDDENYASKLAQKMKDMEDEESDDDESVASDDDDSSSDDSESEQDEATPQAMDTNVGFDWGTTEDIETYHDNFKEFSTDESSSDEDDDGDEDGDEDDDDAKKGHKSRKKATAKKQQEKEIAKMEQRLADGTADERPETCADFERLLASNPNSSENWIKFMAFHLSLADIESARSVANRAFDKIEFRQEGEKLNVWTALLTLENKYGTPKSFNETIARASQHNNPKQVYLRVCEMLEKDVDQSNGDTAIVARADEMFEKMCKKFKSKKTVWIARFKYLLKSKRHEEAHELLKRSFQSLPDYKHVEAMSKFAQLEYEYGSPERARTIFDALLDKNRKRMDLLFVYVDKEIKHGDIEIARRIFEKAINPPPSSSSSDNNNNNNNKKKKKKVPFSDKQMKSLFKKWYKIEDEHGDEKSKLQVKLAAKEYVERTSKK